MNVMPVAAYGRWYQRVAVAASLECWQPRRQWPGRLSCQLHWYLSIRDSDILLSLQYMY